ncbi:hypothetical protein P3T26_000010 [Streptomyces sp. MAA16]|nr:hypothetical protein [Streptomyces sp. MAA16]
MGFNREPGGTLNSMPTGGRTCSYLTDVIGSVVGLEASPAYDTAPGDTDDDSEAP